MPELPLDKTRRSLAALSPMWCMCKPGAVFAISDRVVCSAAALPESVRERKEGGRLPAVDESGGGGVEPELGGVSAGGVDPSPPPGEGGGGPEAASEVEPGDAGGGPLPVKAD